MRCKKKVELDVAVIKNGEWDVPNSNRSGVDGRLRIEFTVKPNNERRQSRKHTDSLPSNEITV